MVYVEVDFLRCVFGCVGFVWLDGVGICNCGRICVSDIDRVFDVDWLSCGCGWIGVCISSCCCCCICDCPLRDAFDADSLRCDCVCVVRLMVYVEVDFLRCVFGCDDSVWLGAVGVGNGSRICG